MKRATKQGRDNPVRKLSKAGGYSYYVTLPKAFVEALGWRERQKLVVKRSGKKLIIEDWEPGKG